MSIPLRNKEVVEWEHRFLCTHCGSQKTVDVDAIHLPNPRVLTGKEHFVFCKVCDAVQVIDKTILPPAIKRFLQEKFTPNGNRPTSNGRIQTTRE